MQHGDIFLPCLSEYLQKKKRKLTKIVANIFKNLLVVNEAITFSALATSYQCWIKACWPHIDHANANIHQQNQSEPIPLSKEKTQGSQKWAASNKTAKRRRKQRERWALDIPLTEEISRKNTEDTNRAQAFEGRAAELSFFLHCAPRHEDLDWQQNKFKYALPSSAPSSILLPWCNRLDWFSHSPDLTPFEDLWGSVKCKMRDTRPNGADDLIPHSKPPRLSLHLSRATDWWTPS